MNGVELCQVAGTLAFFAGALMKVYTTQLISAGLGFFGLAVVLG